jgi:hypothetical protein
MAPGPEPEVEICEHKCIHCGELVAHTTNLPCLDAMIVHWVANPACREAFFADDSDSDTDPEMPDLAPVPDNVELVPAGPVQPVLGQLQPVAALEDSDPESFGTDDES